MQTKPSTQLLRLFIATLVFTMLLIPTTVSAQSEFSLNLNRDFGYSIGSEIAGTFTIKVVGPEDQIAAVKFMLDDQSMGEVSQAPFRLRFKTQDYPKGIHAFTAEVTLKDGQVLTVGPRRYDFITAEQQGKGMQRVIIPLLAIVATAMLVSGGMQFLTMRGKVGNIAPGTQRNYSVAGGSICSKCKRPTPRHIWGMNIMVGKLDRCENCGKWSIMRAQPIDVLRAAERAEIEQEKPAGAVAEKTEEQKLRDLLDRSKYSE